MKVRVCWASHQNISFRGSADVEGMEYDSIDDAYKDRENEHFALEQSGFEWWIEEVE